MNCLFIISVLLLTVSSFVCIQALECGIQNSSSQKELKQIAESCIKKKEETEKPKKTSSSSSEESDESKEGSTEATKNIRNKRNDENSKSNGSNNATNKPESNNNNNSTDNNNCIVHCIFTQLAMTDNNGYPEHHRVSQALLNKINNRELRDFVQDTTDDCFQLMDQGEQQEPCQYSVTLVTCLSERGKANCADWPIGNLSFLSNKKPN